MSAPEQSSKQDHVATQRDDEEVENQHNNDLVIREGFPALIRTDGKGPLIDGDEPIPSTRFVSYRDALRISPQQTDSILEDCSIVFTARTIDDGAAYSAGDTYFVPCQMKPRCALEALALQIFEAHVSALQAKDGQKIMFDPERSGAEWWTLVMDAAGPTNSEDENMEQKDDDENEDGDEVGMHFDADYGLESQCRHLLLHPRVATVTYLSNVGAPTLVLDKRSPPPADVDKKTLEGKVERAWLSGPQFGKHICFDGRLLHGAPATFFPGGTLSSLSGGEEPAAKRLKMDKDAKSSQTTENKRVTFLVNVWINHCPLDADLLDDDVCQQLKTPWEPKRSTESGNPKGDDSYIPPFEWKQLEKPDDTTKEKLVACESDPAGSEESNICHRLVTVNYGASMDDCHKIARETVGGTSIEVCLGEGALSIDVGKELESSDDEEEERE